MSTLSELLDKKLEIPRMPQPVDPVATDPLSQQQGPSKLGALLDSFMADDTPVVTQAKVRASEYQQIADRMSALTPAVQDPQVLNAFTPVGQEPRPGKIGFEESIIEEFQGPTKGMKQIPILGGVAGAAENLLYLDAAGRLAKGYDYSEPVSPAGPVFGAQGAKPPTFRTREQDEQLISDMISKLVDQQERGYTFGGKVGKGVLQLPTWMAEFALTGGLAKISSEVVQARGAKLLKSWAKTKAGEAALKTAGWAGGAVTRATLGLSPRIIEKATQRQVNVQVLGEEQEGWGTSFAKAWGDVVIEAASEEAGEAITGIPLKILGKTRLGGKLVKSLQSSWMKATGGTAGDFTKKMIKAGGYSNIIGEIGEERLGTILRALTAVEDFGAGPDAGPIERLKKGLIEDAKNIGVEAVVLAVPMGGQVAAQQVGQIIYPTTALTPEDYKRLYNEATAKKSTPSQQPIGETEPKRDIPPISEAVDTTGLPPIAEKTPETPSKPSEVGAKPEVGQTKSSEPSQIKPQPKPSVQAPVKIEPVTNWQLKGKAKAKLKSENHGDGWYTITRQDGSAYKVGKFKYGTATIKITETSPSKFQSTVTYTIDGKEKIQNFGKAGTAELALRTSKESLDDFVEEGDIVLIPVKVETKPVGLKEIQVSGEDVQVTPVEARPVEKKAPRSPEQTQTAKSPEIQDHVTETIETDFTVTKPQKVTSVRQATVKNDRKSLGLDEINSKSRKSWEESLRQAKDENIASKASRIADQVNAEPRPLNDVETAGLTIRLAELKNEHEVAMKTMGKVKDKAETKILSAEIQQIEDEFDSLSRAVNLSGTEKGRALVAQKLTINKDFKLVSVLNRAKVALGHKLSTAQRKMFGFLTSKLDKTNTQIDVLTKEVAELKASSYVRAKPTAKRFSRMTTAQRQTHLSEKVALVNEMIQKGCNN